MEKGIKDFRDNPKANHNHKSHLVISCVILFSM